MLDFLLQAYPLFLLEVKWLVHISILQLINIYFWTLILVISLFQFPAKVKLKVEEKTN